MRTLPRWGNSQQKRYRPLEATEPEEEVGAGKRGLITRNGVKKGNDPGQCRVMRQ